MDHHEFKRVWLEQLNVTPLNMHLADLPGFEPFTIHELYAYYCDANRYGLSFKKEKNKGILYGLHAVALRQALFNSVSLEARRYAVSAKLEAAGIASQVLGVAQQPDFKAMSVIDIGMGRSLYCVSWPTLRKPGVVIKPVTSRMATLYQYFLQEINMKGVSLSECSGNTTQWQLSEYLPGAHVSSTLLMEPPAPSLVQQLACHACLGDVTGRGDRHLENYIVSDGVLYALDISYLFWPNNADYVDLYIAGGQSEATVLAHYPDCATLYWQAYQACYEVLQEKQAALIQRIDAVLTRTTDCSQATQYLTHHLAMPQYVAQRKQAVERQLVTYAQRLKRKQTLADYVEKQGRYTTLTPREKMHYWANKDRLTAFFLDKT